MTAFLANIFNQCFNNGTANAMSRIKLLYNLAVYA